MLIHLLCNVILALHLVPLVTTIRTRVVRLAPWVMFLLILHALLAVLIRILMILGFAHLVCLLVANALLSAFALLVLPIFWMRPRGNASQVPVVLLVPTQMLLLWNAQLAQ